MKKIGILLIAFLLVGAFAFGEEGDISTTWELEASATNTFGIDLEEGTTGFRNEASGSLTVELVPEATAESEGDGWYGWIEVADFSLSVSDSGVSGSADNITAQITDDVVYVQIYSAPSASIANFAPALNGGDAVDPETTSVEGTGDNEEQGITIGYGDGPVNDLSVRVFSYGDWTANEDNKYGLAVNADVEVDIVQIEAGVSFAPFGEDVDDEEVVTGLGGKATVDLTEDDLGLTFYVGADVQIYDEDFGAPATEDHTMFLDLATGLSFGLAPADDDPTNVALDFYLGEVLDYDDADNDYGNVGDLELSFSEDTAGGFVPNVGFGLTVSLWNVLAPAIDSDLEANDLPAPMGNAAYPLTLVLGADGEYDAGGLNPFFNTEFRTAFYDDVVDDDWVDDQVAGFDFTAGLGLGADLHGIQNTDFEVKYEGIELLDEDAIEQYLTFETKISL